MATFSTLPREIRQKILLLSLSRGDLPWQSHSVQNMDYDLDIQMNIERAPVPIIFPQFNRAVRTLSSLSYQTCVDMLWVLDQMREDKKIQEEVVDLMSQVIGNGPKGRIKHTQYMRRCWQDGECWKEQRWITGQLLNLRTNLNTMANARQRALKLLGLAKKGDGGAECYRECLEWANQDTRETERLSQFKGWRGVWGPPSSLDVW